MTKWIAGSSSHILTRQVILDDPEKKGMCVTLRRSILLSEYEFRIGIKARIQDLNSHPSSLSQMLGLSRSSHGPADSSHGIASSAYDGIEISSKLAQDSSKLAIHVSSDVPGSIAAYNFTSKDKVIHDDVMDSDETMPWHEQRILQKTRSNHSGELSDATPQNDDLMIMLALLFINQIKNALEPVLGPVASALQSQGEEERKQRQKLIALEEKKLALKREKIQCLKRRCACRFQPTGRAPFAKSSRLMIRQGLGLQKSLPE